MASRQQTILVTGCAGFIGWKVSELLLDEGHTVIGVDNLNDAYDVRLKGWRLSQLQKRENFTFHKLDITEWPALQALFGGSPHASPLTPHPLHAVVNLAARAGVRPSLEDPWAYYETNVTGTLNLLEFCKKREIEKFVLASTSSVYGSPTQPNKPNQPFYEDQPTDRPLSPYTASKKAAEELCYTYHRLYDLDVSVLRYFTVYGPAGRPDMSPFRFVRWIAEGEPLILYGDGSQERDFTYVDDIARGTLAALRPLGYEVVNLGSDHPVSLRRLIALLEKLLNKRAKIEHHPFHPADVPTTWAGISKARRLLNWEPQTPLEVGLEQIVKWYLQNRSWVREIELPS